MSNLKQLKSAAEELIDVLGMIDEVTEEPVVLQKKVTEDELVEIIKNAAKEITPDDDLSDETRAVVDELLNASKKKTAPAKGKKAPVPEPEEDDEDENDDPGVEAEDDDTEVADNSELIEEIQDAKKLKDLKGIVAENDIFKSSAKKLNAIKDADDLRDAMLELLEPAEVEDDEPEEEEEEEVVDKKKSKKGIPAPAMKEKKTTEKKETVKKEKGLNRQDSVLAAIKALCKKGATLKQIMEYGDNMYVEAGGTSNPTATNVNSYSLSALVAFDVLTKSEEGVYKFKK